MFFGWFSTVFRKECQKIVSFNFCTKIRTDFKRIKCCYETNNEGKVDFKGKL